jgi:hypothetical protein
MITGGDIPALDECADIHAPEKILSAVASTNDAFADEDLCNRWAVSFYTMLRRTLSMPIYYKASKKSHRTKAGCPDLVDEVVERAADLFVYSVSSSGTEGTISNQWRIVLLSVTPILMDSNNSRVQSGTV